ncbi:MAG TPA: alternative ribosome rescue aminoacyl-tRNA hydrolase ArfB [Xanthomonadales bacterium]|nr:alternative ribosome rescue aminoacyl-tRNA hydrolase ArfB [Xanthomonadales bacterium]
MLIIKPGLEIPEDEVQLEAIRAQGAGGQNVNKVSSAIHLRFDVAASSLPEEYKARLLAIPDRRLNSDGVIVIKAQKYRSKEKNGRDAIERLVELIRKATQRQPKRIPTRPSKAAKERRLVTKSKRSQVKQLRGKVDD